MPLDRETHDAIATLTHAVIALLSFSAHGDQLRSVQELARQLETMEPKMLEQAHKVPPPVAEPAVPRRK